MIIRNCCRILSKKWFNEFGMMIASPKAVRDFFCSLFSQFLHFLNAEGTSVCEFAFGKFQNNVNFENREMIVVCDF